MQPTTKSWRRFVQPAIPWAVLAGCILGVYAWLHGGAEPADQATRKEKKVIPVTVETPRYRPVQQAVGVVGTLYGYEEVPLTVKVDGRVIKVHHDVGDIVHPGDPLLDLDPTDYDLAVKEASRSLELELTRIKPGLKDLPAPDFDISEIPGVLRAAAHEKNMKARWERASRLGGALAAEEREAVQRDYGVAAAEVKQAFVEAQALLAAARYKKALLESAQQKLKDTRLSVPTSLNELRFLPVSRSSREATTPEFVVVQRSISEGEMARFLPIGSSVLYKLVMINPLKLKASVPRRYSGQVKLGQRAVLRIEAWPGEEFQGDVARINPAIDKTSRSFEVEIRIKNDDNRLSPGAFARAAILTHVSPKATTVPEEAVIRFAGVSKVFVVENDRVKEVHVRTGAVFEEAGERPRTWVEILSELPANAHVVTSGQMSLAEGSTVRVRE